jgi:xanthine dehydrogenase FAD-binding subunit
LTLETMEEAAREVRRAVAPIDDLRAGADYRREVAGNLLYRLSLLPQDRPEAGS